ncbi:MAG TPA: DNA-binding protein WhiA [Pseudonocardiaceae bacterium]|nr:DNA-binding protein WhiA [Pseudonocardiaceae bacterium]
MGFVQLAGGVRAVSVGVGVAGRAGVVRLRAAAAERAVGTAAVLVALGADPQAAMLTLADPVGHGERGAGVTVVFGAFDRFARHAGLIATGGRQVMGLPVAVLRGGVCDAAAVWRAALLSAGMVASPGRREPGLAVVCPNPALGLALVGLARCLGAPARVQPFGGVDRVVVTDPAGVNAILSAAGGEQTVSGWPRRAQPADGVTVARDTTGFADANNERIRLAARAQAAAIVAIFGRLEPERLPAHLREAGELRLAYPSLSLTELGQLAIPPVTKNTLGGRLRRLRVLAEQ